MQKIEKRREPVELTHWRAANASDLNFGYALLAGKPAHVAVKRALLEEQGWLCAYTGHCLREETAHVEHLLPQAHCTVAESVTYTNLAACFPGPNTPAPGYGATRKADWPSKEEQAQFVSPLSEGCETRFRFRASGEMLVVREDDAAASETIRRLALDCHALRYLRRAALESLELLAPKAARARLNSLERESARYSQFRFAMLQVLRGHLRRIEAIRVSRKNLTNP